MIFLRIETVQSTHAISLAAKTILFLNNEPIFVEPQLIESGSYIAKRFLLESISSKDSLSVEKSVSLYTSKDKARLQEKMDNPMFYSPDLHSEEQVLEYDKVSLISIPIDNSNLFVASIEPNGDFFKMISKIKEKNCLQVNN